MIANRWNPLGKKFSKTAKSYIQNGLIAMWDGIENVGWGEHDANATMWKDLSGNGYDMTLTEHGEFRETSLFSKFNKEGYPYADRSACVASSNLALTALDIGCIETAFNPSFIGTNVSAGGIVFIINYQRAIHITSELIAGSGMQGIYTNAFSHKLTLNTDYAVTFNYAVGESMASPVSAFLNGEPQKLNKSNINISSAKMKVCNDDWNRNMGGKVYCIRIYNRPLTDAEIAHNYAVDKERFGL